MDNFGEKITIVKGEKKDNIVLKHEINCDVFYSWVLNISIMLCGFYITLNIAKIVCKVV